jgi:dienelactone hydrolase
VGDVFSAVDYLTTLPYVDAERIGVLGICAGGGMAVKAASVDRRIKAVGTTSAVNVGAATGKGWEGKGSEADLLATLEALAKQRTAEAAGGELAYAPYVPNSATRAHRGTCRKRPTITLRLAGSIRTLRTRC